MILKDTLIEKISPICKTDDEIKAVPLYVRSDKYRLKMIRFLEKAEEKGETITADQLIILAINMSNKEKQEGLRKGENRNGK